MSRGLIVKVGFMALALYTALLTFALANEPEVLIKEKAHNVYHVIKKNAITSL